MERDLRCRLAACAQAFYNTAMGLILTLLAVALLSSAITGFALWLYYRRVVEPEIERRVDAAIEAIGVEVGKQVRAGVVDGVSDLARGDAVVRTTEKVATKGATVIAESLGVLLGSRSRDRSEDQD